MVFLVVALALQPLVAGPAEACTATPVVHLGRQVATTCAESPADGLVVVDLRSDWTPRLFSEAPDHRQRYRAVYQALAGERPSPGTEGATARRDRYYEIFGIFPTIAVIAGRLRDEARHACHAAIDDRVLAAGSGRGVRAASQVKGVVADRVRAHLRCEGFQVGPTAPGLALEAQALALYQRRHMIPAAGRLDDETRAALTGDSRELDFLTLLRALRERVVDATGLLEDGSAGHAWQPVLGRHLESAEYRTRLRPSPIAGAAPDLIARATEETARALGWTSPAAAAVALARGLPSLVAVRLPAPPAYHGPHMQLRAEIDRGDVWSEHPLDDFGQPRRSPVRWRPTLVIYASTATGEVALVRWPTTIGGWQQERLPDGSETLEYKASPPGRRHWRDLLAAPAWFPPPSTPDRELVRRRADGTWTTDDDAVGPGYRSAYGLMALLHHRTAEGQGEAAFSDAQIRTHGSGNYRSILRGSSHGCHRLFNHLAIRLGSFLLNHRAHVRHGEISEAYARRIVWRGRAMVLRAASRGYRYELTPPIVVDVLPGRSVRSRPATKKPHAPGQTVERAALVGAALDSDPRRVQAAATSP